MPNVFFQILPGKLWGDYGLILVHGESLRKSDDCDERLYNRDLPLTLDRTGPFVPPLFLSSLFNALIVPEASRQILLETYPGLFRFRPVELRKAVWIEWHHWDFDADLPEQLPVDGEPENYLEKGSPSKDAAIAIGQLWEIEVPMGALMDYVFDDLSSSDKCYIYNWSGQDIFYAEKPLARMTRLFCTDAGKMKLERLVVNPFVEFIEVPNVRTE